MRTPDDLRSPARRSSLACGSLRETCARCAKPALAAALLAVLALAGCLLPNGGTPVLVDSRAGSFWSGKGLLLEVSPDQKRCKVAIRDSALFVHRLWVDCVTVHPRAGRE
ncbi:MAG TPA: hypothetical protein VKH41_04180 [Myxococcota bacterium]|nr:hypothetical protein [Myxococcota bacterium]